LKHKKYALISSKKSQFSSTHPLYIGPIDPVRKLHELFAWKRGEKEEKKLCDDGRWRHRGYFGSSRTAGVAAPNMRRRVGKGRVAGVAMKRGLGWGMGGKERENQIGEGQREIEISESR
jgi:hypothetical protein